MAANHIAKAAITICDIMKNYFPHDFNARIDPKLQEVMMVHGVAGIGVYWCIIEMMYEQGGSLLLNHTRSIAFSLHADIEMVESVVRDFDLFVISEDSFTSQSLSRRLEAMNEKSEKAKASINARWKKTKETNAGNTNEPQITNECNTKQEQEEHDDDTNVIRTYNECNTNKINKNKIKENNIISSNIESQKRFTPPTIDDIRGYIEEKGYKVSPEAFYDFYQSKGWMIGRNRMKDWRAAVRTWARGEKNRTSYEKPINHTDKRRGYDVPLDADYSAESF